MGFYARKILPFLTDKMTDTPELAGHRRRQLARASGRTLEIGFGTGLNAAHYPATVKQLVAIEPNEGAGERARKRIAQAPFPIELRFAAGEQLPVDDAGFDCAVTTLVLCTVSEVERTLSEIARALAPGGRYLFFEHGLSDDPGVQKWQRRMNGFQMRMFGGCRLDRPIRALVESAGFQLEDVQSFHLAAGPRFGTFMTLGSAIKR